MKKQITLLLLFAVISFAACNSVQKSVDPTGRNPIPRGPERSIDGDTIRPPGSDTSGVGIPDSVKRGNK